ncbi:MAG: hypothetical protein EOO61_16790, partial [Hymenobacter sp.]
MFISTSSRCGRPSRTLIGYIELVRNQSGSYFPLRRLFIILFFLTACQGGNIFVSQKTETSPGISGALDPPYDQSLVPPVETPRATPAIPAGQAEIWLTTKDLQTVLQRQPYISTTSVTDAQDETIIVDPNVRYQPYYGVGAGMPESSAYLIQNIVSESMRKTLLRQLFDPDVGAGLSVLRLTMGASDFTHVGNYSYDDSSTADFGLTKFSLSHDLDSVVPVSQQAQIFNSSLRLVLSPWSPPAWMKANNNFIGITNNTLIIDRMGVLADYFIRSIKSFQNFGLNVWAITPQNEPQFASPTYPSMLFSASDEATFVRDFLAPKLSASGLTTII